MKACYVFSLESPRRDDFNEYTQHTVINTKNKIIRTYHYISADMVFFPRDSRTSSI